MYDIQDECMQECKTVKAVFVRSTSLISNSKIIKINDETHIWILKIGLIIKKKFSKQMAERRTIMIDEDVAKKVRNLQAKKIKETAGTVSFSAVINEMLRECNKS